mgnify:CR=1 FL=1
MVNPFIVEPTEKKIDLPPWTDKAGKVWTIWLMVKCELSKGEHDRMLKKVSSVTQRIPPVRGAKAEDAVARMEWTEYSHARFEAYVTDWSLAHEPESKLPATLASFEKLHRDLAELIDNAIDAHEQAVSLEKKVTSISREPDAMSA